MISEAEVIGFALGFIFGTIAITTLLYWYTYEKYHISKRDKYILIALGIVSVLVGLVYGFVIWLITHFVFKARYRRYQAPAKGS